MNKIVLFLLTFFALSLGADTDKDMLQIIRKLGYCCAKVVQSIETVENNKFVIVKFDINHETCKKNIIFISRDNGKTFTEKTIPAAQQDISFDQIAVCNNIIYMTQGGFSLHKFRVLASYNLGNDFMEIRNTDINWRDCAAEKDLVIKNLI
jgi:hypothetical protein